MKYVIVSALGFLAGERLIDGIDAADTKALLLALFVFVMVQGIVGFFTQLALLPLTVLTFGLGFFLAMGVANYLSLWVVAELVPGFTVTEDWTKIALFTLLVAAAQWLMNQLFPSKRSVARSQRKSTTHAGSNRR